MLKKETIYIAKTPYQLNQAGGKPLGTRSLRPLGPERKPGSMIGLVNNLCSAECREWLDNLAKRNLIQRIFAGCLHLIAGIYFGTVPRRDDSPVEWGGIRALRAWANAESLLHM